MFHIRIISLIFKSCGGEEDGKDNGLALVGWWLLDARGVSGSKELNLVSLRLLLDFILSLWISTVEVSREREALQLSGEEACPLCLCSA